MAGEKSSSTTAKTEKKQWAGEHLKGMENLFMPSFSPDFKELDEEGIRHDVRESIKHGFCACSISPSTGITVEQRQRMIEIVRSESTNKIMTSGIVGGSEQAQIEELAHAEKTGCSHALVQFPGGPQPESEEEVYTRFRRVIDSTSLGIVLYGSNVSALRRFHPSGIPINVFDRLADVPNVIAVKLTHVMNVTTAYALCERLSDRLILGPVNLDHVLLLAKHYRNIQWSGEWICRIGAISRETIRGGIHEPGRKGSARRRCEGLLGHAAARAGHLRFARTVSAAREPPLCAFEVSPMVYGGKWRASAVEGKPIYAGSHTRCQSAYQEQLQESWHYASREP